MAFHRSVAELLSAIPTDSKVRVAKALTTAGAFVDGWFGTLKPSVCGSGARFSRFVVAAH
jgi:hypothetical protein